MTFYIKNFKEFLNDLLEQQVYPKIVKKIQKELAEENTTCPRCGKSFDKCICQEKDPASTVNLYRFKSSTKNKIKNQINTNIKNKKE